MRLEAFLVAVVDASLFAQNLCIAFESLGYGICYIGGLRNRLDEVDGLLELPHGVYPLYGLCVGRPAEDPVPRGHLGPLFTRMLVEQFEMMDEAFVRRLVEGTPIHAERRFHEMQAADELLRELGIEPVMTRGTVAHLDRMRNNG